MANLPEKLLIDRLHSFEPGGLLPANAQKGEKTGRVVYNM